MSFLEHTLNRCTAATPLRPQASGSAGPKNVRKKEQRLEQWQRTAGQQIAKFNMRAGLIVSRGADEMCLLTNCQHVAKCLQRQLASCNACWGCQLERAPRAPNKPGSL